MSGGEIEVSVLGESPGSESGTEVCSSVVILYGKVISSVGISLLNEYGNLGGSLMGE